MATVAWTVEARQWLEDIFGYIAADNLDAAARTVQGIYERAQILATFPEIGHRYPNTKIAACLLTDMGKSQEVKSLKVRVLPGSSADSPSTPIAPPALSRRSGRGTYLPAFSPLRASGTSPI